MTDDDVKKLLAAMQEVFPTAEMVNSSFQTLTETMTAQFTTVNGRLDYANARLTLIETDIKGLVRRDEFDGLMARVTYIEHKLGIEPGT